MRDLISREDAIRLAEQGQVQGFEWQFKKLCTLPSAEPELHLTYKNCIHLGHAYMMPCKNCKRNQMLPDWYEERKE